MLLIILKNQLLCTKESSRIANEEKRQDDITGEAYRIANEIKRQDNITGEAYRIANEEKRQDNVTGEAYRIANEIKRQQDTATAIKNAETATKNAKDATDEATTAATAANNAVAEFETIKNQSGIVMQTEKGVANGVATLDSSGKVPSSQLKIVNNLTTTTTGSLLDASQGNVIMLELADLKTYIDQTIDGLQKIHFNDTVDDSIGKNGDVLMVPIS